MRLHDETDKILQAAADANSLACDLRNLVVGIQEKTIENDRWESGFRNVVAALLGPRAAFGIDNVIEKVIALKEEHEKMAATLRDFADGDCEYGDNCPTHGGSRHGTCTSCRARAALPNQGEPKP